MSSLTPWPLREADPNWCSDHDYTVGAIRRGSNGKLYCALKASGPNSGGAQNPTSTSAYWISLADLLYDVATQSASGLMSATDKEKLDGIATGAEVNQSAFGKIVVGSTTITADAKIDTLTLVAGANITLTPDATNDRVTIVAKDTIYGAATQSANGLLSAVDKKKLDGIATGAEVNQNAFGKIMVGSTTIAADAKIDTLTLVAGANITLTPDAAADKVTIVAKDTTYTSMTGATASAAGKMGLTPAPAAGAQVKYLRGDGTWQTPPNTTYGVATQGANGLLSATDKKALDYGEAFRLSMIGVPRFWRSTTLPAGHVWANGDLVRFSDWPELKKVYDAGGFNGMLLAYNANAATITANLGKWRPNAANPTGLYVPKLGDQFFRDFPLTLNLNKRSKI